MWNKMNFQKQLLNIFQLFLQLTFRLSLPTDCTCQSRHVQSWHVKSWHVQSVQSAHPLFVLTWTQKFNSIKTMSVYFSVYLVFVWEWRFRWKLSNQEIDILVSLDQPLSRLKLILNTYDKDPKWLSRASLVSMLAMLLMAKSWSSGKYLNTAR